MLVPPGRRSMTEDRRLCEPKVMGASAPGELLASHDVKSGQVCDGLRVLGTEFGAVLDQARHGDDAGFARLWRDLQPAVLRYFRVVAPADHEDLASETWLRVSEGLARFAG